mgnify:CR=1 FL=1
MTHEGRNRRSERENGFAEILLVIRRSERRQRRRRSRQGALRQPGRAACRSSTCTTRQAVSSRACLARGSGPHRAPASPGRFCRTPTEIPDGAQPSRCALNQAGIADASRAAALGLFCTDLSAAKDADGAFLERDAPPPIFQIGQRRRKRRGRRERNHARKRRHNGRRRQSAGQRAKTDSIRCSPIRDVANVGNVGDVAGRVGRRYRCGLSQSYLKAPGDGLLPSPGSRAPPRRTSARET